MVEQTKDSTLTDYGLGHAETGLLNSDKQLSASLAAKNSALQDSHNENPMTVSKSIEDPLLLESGRAGQIVQISGTKRPLTERLLSPPKSNAGGGHIVYVRRKPETELAKSHLCESQSDAVDCAFLRQSTEQDEEAQQLAEMSESMIGSSDVSPLEGAYSPSFSQTRDDRILANIKLWEERYRRLQRLLKSLDESRQDDYVQMLRSLSSVELSQHAVELEKRSIKLQLEEARELQRVGLSDERNAGHHMHKSDSFRK